MSDVTITLRGRAAEKLMKLVAERYARPEEAVEDALDALDANRDESLDAWLRETVMVRAEAAAADSDRLRTPEQVRKSLLER